MGQSRLCPSGKINSREVPVNFHSAHLKVLSSRACLFVIELTEQEKSPCGIVHYGGLGMAAGAVLVKEKGEASEPSQGKGGFMDRLSITRAMCYLCGAGVAMVGGAEEAHTVVIRQASDDKNRNTPDTFHKGIGPIM